MLSYPSIRIKFSFLFFSVSIFYNAQQHSNAITREAIKNNKVKSATEWNMNENFEGLTIYYDTNGLQTHYYFYLLSKNGDNLNKELNGKRIFTYDDNKLLIQNDMFSLTSNDTNSVLLLREKRYYNSKGDIVKNEFFNSSDFNNPNFIINYFYSYNRLDSIIKIRGNKSYSTSKDSILYLKNLEIERFQYFNDSSIVLKYENGNLIEKILKIKNKDGYLFQCFSQDGRIMSEGKIECNEYNQEVYILLKSVSSNYEMKKNYCENGLLESIYRIDLDTKKESLWTFLYEYF